MQECVEKVAGSLGRGGEQAQSRQNLRDNKPSVIPLAGSYAWPSVGKGESS